MMISLTVLLIWIMTGVAGKYNKGQGVKPGAYRVSERHGARRHLHPG